MSNEPVVVIGSGPSGAAAAARLVERGADVVVLDAGDRAPRGLVVRAAGRTLVRRMGWSLYSTDRHAVASDPVSWYSSLSLGGLSNYWTSAVPRFHPLDFSEGARIDERFRWPIGYDDLVPWYELSERLLTVTAGTSIGGVPDNVRRYEQRLPDDWQEIVEQAARAGHGIGPMPMAKGHPWMLARRGTEFSSYHCVIRPLERRRRLRLVRGARVSRLVWSPSKGRVVGVDYVDPTGAVITQACRAVVLAAGTIDSTIIALRSVSDDFPDGIGNTRGLVGRYLHDHPRTWWAAASSRPLTALTHPVYIARAPHDSSPPLLATSLTIGLASPSERVRAFYGGRTPQFGVQVFGTMVPTDSVGVSIPDPAEPDPRRVRPTLALRYDRAAAANMGSSPERLADVLSAAGVSVTDPEPIDDLHPGTSVHFGGTMRMHDDPEHGVVDGVNRMYDVPNLVVSDMSCFTTGPEKNPTLTAMAISMRAADHLATDLGHGPASDVSAP